MEPTPKVIEIQGITRHATKIGVRDGQAEDLINLRFMDGSWRASGDGRLIQFTMGREYSQLYVHTNIYHHLLGVYEGTLYWFAEIGTDGTSFYPLDNTTSRTQWPEDMQDLPTKPKRLTEVVGDIWIVQNGHLLTVIDENDDFEHFIFKTGEDKYVETTLNINGRQNDRTLYPYGKIHFNVIKENVSRDSSFSFDTRMVAQSKVIELLKSATDKNYFTQPFLVLVCCKLYDGSYVYASNPVLIDPFEMDKGGITKGPGKVFYENGVRFSSIDTEEGTLQYGAMKWTFDEGNVDDGSYLGGDKVERVANEVLSDSYDKISRFGIFKQSVNSYHGTGSSRVFHRETVTVKGAYVNGAKLTLSIENTDILDDTIKSIAIFVTRQSDVYDLTTTESKLPYIRVFEKTDKKYFSSVGADIRFNNTYIDYKPNERGMESIIYDLLHSPFYLLREYDSNSILELKTNPIIDLTKSEYKERLSHITDQPTLPIETLSRTTYMPKVAYQYNGRLHIANYKSYPFFGYPIDLFHLHNHSVKVQSGSYFKGVLPNLAANNDEYLQYPKTDYDFTDLSNNPEYFVYVKVTIDGSNGEQQVVRYIQPYDHSTPVDGRADFIESLNPLLCYPDIRAKKMEISLYQYSTETVQGWRHIGYKVVFTLKPHPYLNIAYYIDPELKPISLGGLVSTLSRKVPPLVNAEEYFPNGMKVSKPDDPMFFPVENTYQVGSAEILALMSNTLPVGTGQTGDAPLYIFCKDGVYAAFVDASGEMVYPNTRPLAPDVCNNPRSVTKTDLGVVFTTDRGLMRMNGNAVEEIGQPAEGDVVHFVDPTKVDYSKYATDALTKIARLPSSLCDTMDFLTYLQGAIINYNHNMRELIVTNPTKSYSYVLDREGNWSRRTYTAKQYVSNYPTSYRLTEDGYFFKMDEEGDVNTSLEHRKEADNSIFYISNVIKLDSIGFKQAYRFVVRGYFETQMIDHSLLHLSDVSDVDEEGFILVDHIPVDRFGYINIDEMGVDDEGYIVPNGVTTQEIIKQFDLEQHVGIVVEGSYDGIKFNPLGYNRRTGKFTDIGCLVSHTDMRFYRIILAGQVTGKTRIDYMEMSASGSVLNTKIR